IPPYPAELSWIEKIHSPHYIQHVQEACRAGYAYLDSGDTGICPASYEIARLAVGGVLAAVDAVMAGKVRNAFCAIRPPGHHAERTVALGFCIFNNIAIAARYIQEKYHLSKVLIIDWDVHHGNGTQHAFYTDPGVFYFSIHQYPHYPGTGAWEECGAGAGLGTTLNAPMPPGCEDEDYLKVFSEKLKPEVKSFKPDFILISAGFDAHRDDPLSGMCLTEEGFGQMTEMVKNFADQTCNGRIVSLLEGGYNLTALGRSVEQHLRILKS
ncbi:MAG: histone deacetylase, partial [candidate division KSB1 bacterium]|nr:histone deacetylase [candidate division KSB1 bacterium]